MKKIIYSRFTKFIAVILVIASAAGCVSVITDCIIKLSDNKNTIVYNFENSFSESFLISSMLSEPIYAVYNAYTYYSSEYSPYDSSSADSIRIFTFDPVYAETGLPYSKYISRIQNNLEHLRNSEKIEYFIRINGTTLSNCGAQYMEELTDNRYFSVLKKDISGNISYESSTANDYSYYFDNIFDGDTITICTAINDSYANECETLWDNQAGIVKDTFFKALGFVLLIILLLSYLISVSAKSSGGEYRLMWLDSVWTEIHIAVIVLSVIAALGAGFMIFDQFLYGHFPLYMIKPLILVITSVGTALVITSLLSVIRKIKSKTFLGSSVICIVLIKTWNFLAKTALFLFGHIKSALSKIVFSLSRKTGLILIVILLIYTCLIEICGIFTPETYAAPVIAIILFVIACLFIAFRSEDLDEIKKGAGEVKNGNLTYKIPEPKCSDMRELSDDINEIAAGLDRSVAEKLKAERLKTDLITNVSHDLKTPLTSIISYTELLSKMDGLPEEAKDYIGIIAKKSDRLKNLTRDLFDISKVHSGNEEIIPEKIDVALLINQSLGEHDSEIKKSGLPFCLNIEKELYISADGRKMSRVISNLIGNILKYTLKNTRVFISAVRQDGTAVIEFKNIASYPMEFDGGEITERFVRGDKSRSTEGNGLGLAIAKSYTEACDGVFDVITDGDMFKVIIRFNII